MIHKETIYYSPASEDRTLHIYLPDDYYETDRRYPVMYFWDGHNLFLDSDATYGKSWGLKEFLDLWGSDHLNRPEGHFDPRGTDHPDTDHPRGGDRLENPPKLIITGIECSHQGTHRLDEYCPYDAELMGTKIHGEGSETMDWMTRVLKPYIDEHYRTLPSRETTAIGGSSMGGLMSLYAVTQYNDVYSKAACISSSLFMVQDPLRRDISACNLHPDTRIYLSWGDREAGDDPNSPFANYISEVNHNIQSLLNAKKVLTSLYLQKGGRHCEADWEKQLPIFMNYLWL